MLKNIRTPHPKTNTEFGRKNNSTISKTRKTMIFGMAVLFLTALACPISSAQADDETRNLIGGIALGVLGMAMDSASDNKQQAEESEIQWNDKKTARPASSKPKLTYDDKTAEIQLKLKKEGYYAGKIDGLKGSGTSSAIQEWEKDNGTSIDQLLSENELITEKPEKPAESNSSEKQSNKVAKDENKSKQNTRLKALESALKNESAMDAFYSICKRYKDMGNYYTEQLDETMESNYKRLSNKMNKQIEKRRKCLDLSKTELSEMKKEADQKIEQDQEMQMINYAFHSIIAGENDPMGLINACNAYSQKLYATYNTLSNKFDAEQCIFVE